MKKTTISKTLIGSVLGNSAFQKYGALYDANDTSLKTGIYGINRDSIPSVTNIPESVNYGMMIVFSGEQGINLGTTIHQVIVQSNGDIFVRAKFHTYQFMAWRKITTSI